MSPPKERRLPLAPLYALGKSVDALPDRHDGFTTLRLARLTGVHPRNFHRWRRAGGIPIFTAGRVACRLGYHPSLVWPEWFQLG